MSEEPHDGLGTSGTDPEGAGRPAAACCRRSSTAAAARRRLCGLSNIDQPGSGSDQLRTQVELVSPCARAAAGSEVRVAAERRRASSHEIAQLREAVSTVRLQTKRGRLSRPLRRGLKPFALKADRASAKRFVCGHLGACRRPLISVPIATYDAAEDLRRARRRPRCGLRRMTAGRS